MDLKRPPAKPTSNMFDLEQAIIGWRRQMLAAGIKTPVPLEELEIHLHDEFEQQMQSGLNAQQSFEAAVRRIGQSHALKLEFKKVGVSSIPLEIQFVKLAGIACAAVAGFFSLWILLALLTVHEANPAERVLGLAAVASVLLSWRYGHVFLPATSNPRARTAAGAACCLASIGGMMLFIEFLQHSLGRIPVGQLFVSSVWAWSALAILGGMANGLEKAARKTNERYV